MIEIKVFLYDSSTTDYRGTDYSSYCLQGQENKEDISDVLDTSEITLLGINKKERFCPDTKFILIVCENGEEIEVLHRIVKEDFVTQPILNDNTYFRHDISLTEPSANAQKRVVDNISCTYKLKDVKLETETTFDITEKAKFINTSDEYTPQFNFGEHAFSSGEAMEYQGKRFIYEGKTNIIDKDGNEIDLLYSNINKFGTEESGFKAKFKIPKLKILYGKNGTKEFEEIGYASIWWQITEYTLNGKETGKNYNGNFISNSLFNNSEYIKENTIDEQQYSPYPSGPRVRWRYKKYSRKNATTPTYYTDAIPINSECYYIVKTGLYQFNDYDPAIQKYENEIPTLNIRIDESKITKRRDVYWRTFKSTTNLENINTLQSSIKFQIYKIDKIQDVLISGKPYPVLLLLEKAIMNSNIYDKQDGIPSGELSNENTKVPYYIDPNFLLELLSVNVIENFYNQKNLWEILVEIGHYIHAIPEIKFGKDDKFMITFNRLGETNLSSDKATPVSISNFSGIDDYICETDSYVTNMVQLGGIIDEWLPFKNASDTYLTSNDTAEIITTYGIIELIGLQIMDNVGHTYKDHNGTVIKTIEKGAITELKANIDNKNDATNYVFEENIYKITSLRFDQFPNRGVSIYYKLRDNHIKGCNYQLPTQFNDLYSDYAIKKLIFCSFYGSYPATLSDKQQGWWKDVQVNDFSVRVIYRTQDEVRTTHTRPDIRKFLLASKYDNVPQYKQFNNQQDIVVDSETFGDNMYGTLIRTGNLSYKVQEWVDSPIKLKHKGELAKINEELYYVARVRSIYYTDHIMSVVDYSKDYNELSKVIGIPSEPRFYEISEQSSIKREVAINNYLLLTTEIDNLYNNTPSYDLSHLKDIVFGNESDISYAKYAITTFKGDKDNGSKAETFGVTDHYIDIIKPINAYSSGTTLTYAWKMIDNYSAGDKTINSAKTNYKTLQAVKYCDKFGKATLFDYYIIKDIPNFADKDLQEIINNLPISPIHTKQISGQESTYIGACDILSTNVDVKDDNYNGRGKILLKDNREVISFNYNLQAITDSDKFIYSKYLFSKKEENNVKYKCKAILLDEEVNKLSGGFINNYNVLEYNGVYYHDLLIKEHNDKQTVFGKNTTRIIEIKISEMFENISQEWFDKNVKAIAICFGYNEYSYKTRFVIARNAPKKTENWYIGIPIKDKIFTNKQ